jgi:hypothetical protein
MMGEVRQWESGARSKKFAPPGRTPDGATKRRGRKEKPLTGMKRMKRIRKNLRGIVNQMRK